MAPWSSCAALFELHRVLFRYVPSIHEEALKKEKPPIIVIPGKWGNKPNEIEGRVENAGRSTQPNSQELLANETANKETANED